MALEKIISITEIILTSVGVDHKSLGNPAYPTTEFKFTYDDVYAHNIIVNMNHMNINEIEQINIKCKKKSIGLKCFQSIQNVLTSVHDTQFFSEEHESNNNNRPSDQIDPTKQNHKMTASVMMIPSAELVSLLDEPRFMIKRIFEEAAECLWDVLLRSHHSIVTNISHLNAITSWDLFHQSFSSFNLQFLSQISSVIIRLSDIIETQPLCGVENDEDTNDSNSNDQPFQKIITLQNKLHENLFQLEKIRFQLIHQLLSDVNPQGGQTCTEDRDYYDYDITQNRNFWNIHDKNTVLIPTKTEKKRRRDFFNSFFMASLVFMCRDAEQK
jgi:hypothetical protein